MEKLLKGLKKLNEYLPFLMALMIWFALKPILRSVDPTAGIDDLGLLQALVFGLVQFYAAAAFSWIALRIIFPKIGNYVDTYFEWEFGDADKKHRLWLSLSLFAIYFFGAIIIFASTI